MANKDLLKAINDQQVLKARVTKKVPNPEQLLLDVHFTMGSSAITPGILSDSGTSDYLVGMEIPVVIKGTAPNGLLICSRELAQEILKTQMMKAFKEGRVFDGVITGFTDFGAFVDVNGIIGLLRNTDYSSDYSRVYERYQVGDHISVKCKKVYEDKKQRIEWEPVVKYRRTTPFVCDLVAGSVVLGRVIDVKNFESGPAVFVRTVGHNEVDILCAMPLEMEIQKGAGVVVRVSSVEPAPSPTERPRLRGYILRLS